MRWDFSLSFMAAISNPECCWVSAAVTETDDELGLLACACFTTNRATSAGKKAAAQRAKSVMSLAACATLTRSRCAPRFPQVVAMIKELLETRIRPAVQVRQ